MVRFTLFVFSVFLFAATVLAQGAATRDNRNTNTDSNQNVGSGARVDRGHVTVPMEAIRRTILSNMDDVRSCFVRARRDMPTLHGHLTVRFVIRGDGNVSDVAVTQAEMPSELMNVCLVQAIGRWRFFSQAGGGTITVNYPFDLADDNSTPPPSPRRNNTPTTPAPTIPARTVPRVTH